MANSSVVSPSSSHQAAMLLLMMGEEQAAEVLRHIDSDSVEKIGMAMAAIREVNHEQAEAVVSRFQETIESQTSLGVGVSGYVRKVLMSSLGEDRGKTLADRVLGDDEPLEIDSLRWMDLDTVVHMLRDEHPQIVAITLAHMSQDQAAYIVKQLPVALQDDVVLRIATLEKIPQAAMRELQDILHNKMQLSGNFKSKAIDGASTAASIINNLGGDVGKRIISSLEKTDSKLTEKLKDLMFVFANLVQVTDKGMQLLLREVSTDLLTVALKGADEKVRDKLFRNMSKRAGEMLLEDMEARGPVKLSEVETAQKEIITIARRLAEDGTISLGGNGDDYVQ
ncbi:MAG: flagellar motor switch protein FliG [Paraperlucidibaca sp.]